MKKLCLFSTILFLFVGSLHPMEHRSDMVLPKITEPTHTPTSTVSPAAIQQPAFLPSTNPKKSRKRKTSASSPAEPCDKGDVADPVDLTGKSPTETTTAENPFYCRLCKENFFNYYAYKAHRKHNSRKHERLAAELFESGELPESWHCPYPECSRKILPTFRSAFQHFQKQHAGICCKKKIGITFDDFTAHTETYHADCIPSAEAEEKVGQFCPISPLYGATRRNRRPSGDSTNAHNHWDEDATLPVRQTLTAIREVTIVKPVAAPAPVTAAPPKGSPAEEMYFSDVDDTDLLNTPVFGTDEDTDAADLLVWLQKQ